MGLRQFSVGFFLAGSLHFHWTLAGGRGALEKGMNIAAGQQEHTGQRETAGEQRKRTIHLP